VLFLRCSCIVLISFTFSLFLFVADPLFGLGANVALIFSGQYVRFVSALRANLPPGVDPWGMSLKYLMGAVFASGGCLVGIFSYMQRKVMTDPACVDQEKQAAKKKKKKTKMGLRESAKFLMSSPYIRDLAMLVISYGMCINLVEVSWKSKLKAAFPDPNAYSAFMGNFSSATGSVTLIMMLLGRKIFQKFGWRWAAMVTPSMIGITGLIFYALTIFAPFFVPIAASLGTTPLMLAVIVGAAQNILSKSAKYSLFDPCKEMAYIPLDQDSKTKGKAAVDVVGNPLGKSGGALIQQFLIFGVGSLAAATPVSRFVILYHVNFMLPMCLWSNTFSLHPSLYFHTVACWNSRSIVILLVQSSKFIGWAVRGSDGGRS
jgi:AAA family ATP:ADP antiporter